MSIGTLQIQEGTENLSEELHIKGVEKLLYNTSEEQYSIIYIYTHTHTHTHI
jgi:hypothetical protein